jgi:hypothetical protein
MSFQGFVAPLTLRSGLRRAESSPSFGALRMGSPGVIGRIAILILNLSIKWFGSKAIDSNDKTSQTCPLP